MFLGFYFTLIKSQPQKRLLPVKCLLPNYVGRNLQKRKHLIFLVAFTHKYLRVCGLPVNTRHPCWSVGRLFRSLIFIDTSAASRSSYIMFGLILGWSSNTQSLIYTSLTDKTLRWKKTYLKVIVRVTTKFSDLVCQNSAFISVRHFIRF